MVVQIKQLKQEGSYWRFTEEDASSHLMQYEVELECSESSSFFILLLPVPLTLVQLQVGTYLLRPSSCCKNFVLSYVVQDDVIEHSEIRLIETNSRITLEFAAKTDEVRQN